MALTCLLAPTTPDIVGASEKLLDSALAAPGYKGKVYAAVPKALAEYRSGRPAEAVVRLEQLLKDLAAGKAKTGRFVPIHAHAALALAHHSLGQRDRAREALDRALTFAPAKIAVPVNGDYGSWHEWLTLHIHIREARALIEAKP